MRGAAHLAKLIGADAVEDREEPGADVGASRVATERAKGAEVGLLHQILGVGGVPRHPVGGPVELPHQGKGFLLEGLSRATTHAASASGSREVPRLASVASSMVAILSVGGGRLCPPSRPWMPTDARGYGVPPGGERSTLGAWMPERFWRLRATRQELGPPAGRQDGLDELLGHAGRHRVSREVSAAFPARIVAW